MLDFLTPMNAVKLFFVSFARVLILTRPSRDESLEFRLTANPDRSLMLEFERVGGTPERLRITLDGSRT